MTLRERWGTLTHTLGDMLSGTRKGYIMRGTGAERRQVFQAFMEHIRTGLIFVALGAAFVAGALLSWLHTRRFVAEAVPAIGEVVGLHEHHDDGVTYAPIIRFPGPGGRPFEFTESTSSNPPGYSVGDRVKILLVMLMIVGVKLRRRVFKRVSTRKRVEK